MTLNFDLCLWNGSRYAKNVVSQSASENLENRRNEQKWLFMTIKSFLKEELKRMQKSGAK